jgi:hypothetical protein
MSLTFLVEISFFLVFYTVSVECSLQDSCEWGWANRTGFWSERKETNGDADQLDEAGGAHFCGGVVGLERAWSACAVEKRCLDEKSEVEVVVWRLHVKAQRSDGRPHSLPSTSAFPKKLPTHNEQNLP